MDSLSRMPTVRVYTKADPSYSLAIRDGRVILAPNNLSDPSQHWVKYSSEVTDVAGFPSIQLVNKATGQAIKHPLGPSQPVELVPYVPDVLDESVLWALASTTVDGYRAIRMVNNTSLNLDAFVDGSINDGTIIGVKEWLHLDNQLWQMIDVPAYQVFERLNGMPSVRVYTKADTNFSLAIRNANVIVTPTNLSDPFQHWVKDETFSSEVTDDAGFPAFQLVNKATGQAIKHSRGASHPVELIPYVPDVLDMSVLWTLASATGDGYRAMRMVNNTSLNLDAFHDGSIRDGTIIGVKEWLHLDNQLWQMVDVPTYQDFDRLSRMPSVRVYAKAETNFSLTIRNGNVILAPTNLSDPFQHWVKDEKYSEVVDVAGFPSFQLVNKASGLAMKHSVGASQPVELIPYAPDVLDESVLWTLASATGDGYRAMRMVNNTSLNLDAFHDDGSIRDGTIIGVKEWLHLDNQLWQMVDVPTYQVFERLSRMPSVRVYTKADTNFSLAIRNANVILAPTNLSDLFQHWVKDETYSEVVDSTGFPSFQLVNKASGLAMKHSFGASHPVELVRYVPDVLDESVLWTLSPASSEGYSAMRMVNNTSLNLDAFHDGSIRDGTIIGVKAWLNSDNQQWQIVLY